MWLPRTSRAPIASSVLLKSTLCVLIATVLGDDDDVGRFDIKTKIS